LRTGLIPISDHVADSWTGLDKDLGSFGWPICGPASRTVLGHSGYSSILRDKVDSMLFHGIWRHRGLRSVRSTPKVKRCRHGASVSCGRGTYCVSAAMSLFRNPFRRRSGHDDPPSESRIRIEGSVVPRSQLIKRYFDRAAAFMPSRFIVPSSVPAW
jgi:hypothetical protein